MLPSQFFSFRKRLICKRNFAMLNALEAFPHDVKYNPTPIGSRVVQESVLRNGIKVISSDCGNSKISTVKVTITCGSQVETISQKGSAHLAAVSAFNGTARTSGLRLARSIENLGAIIGSSSDREKIVFEVKVLPDGLESALETISDSIKFKAKPLYLIKEAKSVAQISYDKLKSSPDDQVTELLFEAAYGELTPLGGSIYADNLENLSEKDVASFTAENFKSGNVIVSASGVSHDSIKQLTESIFVDIPVGVHSESVSPYLGGNVRVKADLGGLTYIGLGFEVSSDSAFVHEILSKLLIKRLAVHKGSIRPVFNTFSKSGLFGFIFSGEPLAATSYMNEFVKHLKDISKDCPNVDTIKKQIKLDYALATQSDDTSVLLSLVTKGTDLKKLDGISSKQISAAASAALASLPAYVVLGKTHGVPSFANVLCLLK